MHLVASGAGNLVVGMAAFEPPDMRRLIQMAGETDFIGGRRGEFRGIADIVS
jgi:hypothetical protein